MLLCPDCYISFDINNEKECKSCNWQLESVEDIPILLSNIDKNDHTFQDYLQNYDKISIDDLEQSIQNETYLNIQQDKLFSYLGDVSNFEICEVGIGQGHLLKRIMKHQPKRVVGIDISIPYMKQYKSQSNISVLLANAENIPFKDEFDLLIASDILEHVFNVGDFLASANRAIKDTGKFVVRVPFNENLMQYSKLMGCPYKFVHLRSFSKQTLIALLTKAGFKIQKLHYDGFYPDKLRPFIANLPKLEKLFNFFTTKYFKDIHHVASINNHLGKFLMEPIEITAVCTKTHNIL